ncbi:hypothetical protein EVAR_60220_1 [Eumeta japonica]|uniref:Uncharacterized protein n=1 Tax=Eumeta variegata TaxID=151549 RepID=A0A4C1Z6Q0_EUMVA|nr:hypothetical protein EVAR_60220_1 [Eumeta japonica]
MKNHVNIHRYARDRIDWTSTRRAVNSKDLLYNIVQILLRHFATEAPLSPALISRGRAPHGAGIKLCPFDTQPEYSARHATLTDFPNSLYAIGSGRPDPRASAGSRGTPLHVAGERLIRVFREIMPLYQAGLTPPVQALYPDMAFPVPPGTPVSCSSCSSDAQRKMWQSAALPNFFLTPRISRSVGAARGAGTPRAPTRLQPGPLQRHSHSTASNPHVVPSLH